MAACDKALTLTGQPEGSLIAPEQRMQLLRADREAHTHRQLWTKLPHGGPYRKVNATQGRDPLLQLADGTPRQVELGYERVRAGPTTNFVGNHMTQGAIDLVQSELEERAEQALLLQQQPTLLPLPPGEAVPLPRPEPRPLHRYSWSEGSSSVTIEVQLPPQEQLQGQTPGTGVTATCAFTPTSLDLSLAPTDPTAPAALAHASRRLRIAPLSHLVLPARCACWPKGLPALPACTSEPVEAAAGAEPAAESSHVVRFPLPNGCEVLVLRLEKAENGLAWHSLQGDVVVETQQSSARAPGPDLVTLRRMLRQQHGKHAGVAAANKTN